MFEKKNLWWLLGAAVLAVFPLIVTNPADTSIASSPCCSWRAPRRGICSRVIRATSPWVRRCFTVVVLTPWHWCRSTPICARRGDVLVGAARGTGGDVGGAAIGWMALRVRRHTFVVITIAIFFIFQLAAINFNFTGGTSGLALPFIQWGFSYYNVPFYYVALGLVYSSPSSRRACGARVSVCSCSLSVTTRTAHSAWASK